MGNVTTNGNFKRRVRARSAKTGESYTAALSHLREEPVFRLAVGQFPVCEDPRDIASLRAGGEVVRRLMREARRQGARLLHLPEGATCSPHKLAMSGPDTVGPAQWDRLDGAILTEELAKTASLARELKLWTVLGSVHQLTPPHRPHNSLYVISDAGAVVTRYDERLLSNTKLSFMYSPGTEPITFDAGGLRFGLSLGMESHFPEIFLAYEALEVDCVLFSTAGPGVHPNPGVFAAEAQAHAATNSYWVSYSVTSQDVPQAPSGIVNPQGQWVARCPATSEPAVAVVDLVDPEVNYARPWRRSVRAGIHAGAHVSADPRSESRASF